MAESIKAPTRISASVTIEGPAEEILAVLRQARGGRRIVHLTIETGRGYVSPHHLLPAIRDGQIQAALEKIDLLARQTVIDGDAERRLDGLIRDFGDVTR